MNSYFDDDELLVCEEPLLSPQASKQQYQHLTSTPSQGTSALETKEDSTDLIRQILGRPFSISLEFWKCFVASALIGITTGVTAILFCGVSERTYKLWKSCVVCSTWNGTSQQHMGNMLLLWEEPEVRENFKQGDWCWLLITILGSTLAGMLLVWGSGNPSILGTVRNLFHEAQDLGLDPSPEDLKVAPYAIISCFISLCCGASVGPEAGLGLITSFICKIVSRYLFAGGDRRSKAALSVTSLSAAMGCLMPSPFLSVLLTIELSLAARPGAFSLDEAFVKSSGGESARTSPTVTHDFMEQVVLMTIAATTSWSVISPFRSTNDSGLQVLDTVGFHHYAAASLLGLICGVLGMAFLLLQGILKQIAQRLSGRILRSSSNAVLLRRLSCVPCLFPLLAGLVYGIIGVAYPLTLGSGYEILSTLISSGLKEESVQALAIITKNGEKLSPSYLFVTALMKVLATAVCLGFGLVGGQVVPLILAGVCLGFAMAFYSPTLFAPVALSVACGSIGIVGAFLPIPLTLVSTMLMSMNLPNNFGGPLMVCYLVSYTVTNIIFTGGVIKTMSARKYRSPDISQINEEF